MTTPVKYYHADGANRQVQAVLAMFQYLLADGIEDSWDDTFKDYKAEIEVARWENCREQGYTLMMRAPWMSGNRLNIAFYEHRNHDGICAIKWEQNTLNSPTIDTLPDGVFENKWEVSYEVKWGEVTKMAKWLFKEFEHFWIENTSDER